MVKKYSKKTSKWKKNQIIGIVLIAVLIITGLVIAGIGFGRTTGYWIFPSTPSTPKSLDECKTDADCDACEICETKDRVKLLWFLPSSPRRSPSQPTKECVTETCDYDSDCNKDQCVCDNGLCVPEILKSSSSGNDPEDDPEDGGKIMGLGGKFYPRPWGHGSYLGGSGEEDEATYGGCIQSHKSPSTHFSWDNTMPFFISIGGRGIFEDMTEQTALIVTPDGVEKIKTSFCEGDKLYIAVCGVDEDYYLATDYFPGENEGEYWVPTPVECENGCANRACICNEDRDCGNFLRNVECFNGKCQIKSGRENYIGAGEGIWQCSENTPKTGDCTMTNGAGTEKVFPAKTKCIEGKKTIYKCKLVSVFGNVDVCSPTEVNC